jgi:hypothetical protein
MTQSERPDPPRLLGVLPIAFFAATLIAHARDESAWTLLWMCNVSNLVLAAGFLLGRQWLIWLATLWLIVGLPLWIWNTILNDDLHLHSVFTHGVAPFMGLWAIRGRPPVRGAWALALLLGMSLQVFCHFVTPPELNINVSHATYKGLPDVFSSYPVYAALNTLAFAVALWAIEYALVRLWAARPAGAMAAGAMAANAGITARR